MRIRYKKRRWWADYDEHTEETYEFTRKRNVSKEDNLIREEYNTPIPAWLFWFVWRFSLDLKRVEKIRYVMPPGEEINEYANHGPDFLVMEKEFDSKEEADAYTPPFRVLGEITNLKWAKDPYLANAPLEEIWERLEKVRISGTKPLNSGYNEF